MSEAPSTHARGWQRLLMLTVAGIVVIHSAVVGLWLSPDNPIRESVGPGFLASYVNPYFQQSPRAMDPGVQYADEALQVRVRILDEAGEPVESEWVDLTADAIDRKGWVPTRMDLAARTIAVNLNAAIQDLPGDLRPQIQEEVPDDELRNLEVALQDGGATPAETARYFASSFMAVQFGTLYASALWDGTVEQVQVRVGLRRVPDHAERDDVRLADEDFEWFDLGWRDAIRANEAAQQAFDQYVER